MSHPNTDRDKRVADIRIRHKMLKFSFEGQQPPQSLTDIDYLLSVLDGQAVGCGDAEIVARQISDNINQYPITSESVYEWKCMIADALASAQESAATRMRDRCVTKVRQRRDRFQAAADASSLPNDLTASRDAAVAAALTRLLGELQSLTLEGEQEK